MRRPARTLAAALFFLLASSACLQTAREGLADDPGETAAPKEQLAEFAAAKQVEASSLAVAAAAPDSADRRKNDRTLASPPIGGPKDVAPMSAKSGYALGRAHARGVFSDRAVEEDTGYVLEDSGGNDESTVGATNKLVDPVIDALSTFAIDVDTGSYTLARCALEGGTLPQAGNVRVEEWVNAFYYSYADERSEHPFSIHMEGAPLARVDGEQASYVMRVGIQGKRVAKAARAPVHLTFLADVSGSMSRPDRLPLAKEALGLLVGELGPKDSVGLVTYAGATSVVLPATQVTQQNRATILGAIAGLRNGGGTAMASGMELAYREATKALGGTGSSRVIVLSDGDANIGRTSHDEMLQSIKGYVSEGVTMSTVGFGTGNYRDHLMEQLADAGNGNYSYVGSLKDAKKIFVDDLTGTLQVIAKDTKIQVEMNKDVVSSYRLIGYENRDIADRDFRNDKVDAGEIGAGHTVTALYEVQLKDNNVTADIATVRVRYQQPRGSKASEVSARFPASAMKQSVTSMSDDGRFATGVALAAEVLRHSEHMARLGLGLRDAHQLIISGAVGPFAEQRHEFARLIAPLVAGAPLATR